MEDYRFRIQAKSSSLGRLYADLGCTPAELTLQEHIEAINEDNLQTITEAAYGGAMTWFQAAELALDAMDKILDGENDG